MPWPVRQPLNSDEVCRICNHRAGQHESWNDGNGAHCERRDYASDGRRWESGTQFTPHDPPRFRRAGVQFIRYESAPINGTFSTERRYSIQQRNRHLDSDWSDWGTSFPDMDEARARRTWEDLVPNGQPWNSDMEFRWEHGIAPPGIVQSVVIDIETRPFDFHSLPHLSDLANLVNRLAGELYRTTGRKQPLKAIVLERDMMLSMGIPPDTVMQTATGPVKIQADRPLDNQIRGLRADAVFVDEAQALPPSAMLFGVDRTEAPRVQPADGDGIEMRMRNYANETMPASRYLANRIPLGDD